jgi:hypothetical protein
MTIIFNYLFTQAGDGFKTRVPVRILKGKLLQSGLVLTPGNLDGVDLHQWVGKNLAVTISEGVHTISGLAGQ